MPVSHISVCVCTFKRPPLLGRLLGELARLQTDGLFTFSIVVVDNDVHRSAEATVLDFSGRSLIQVHYSVEPQRNISLARNRAVAKSQGDFIAFIDDDEFPTSNWLLTLYKALHTHAVDGVLGPVHPHFDQGTPEWVIKGRFYDRRSYPTGFVISGKQGRTGNVLLKRHLCIDEQQPFRPEFRSGEDQDFFERMIQKGHTFIWCDEAGAYETVPPARCKRRYLLRKALLQGTCASVNLENRIQHFARSIIAIPVYTVAAPFALLLGQHCWMVLLVKLCDHLGQVLGMMGINVVREAYVSE